MVVVVIILAALPAGLPLFALTILTEILILGLLAMSLDLLVGYTRLVSFGHAAAYGLGAYACGNILLHTTTPLIFAVPAAALFAGVVGIGIGWVCTLATGVSFSMLTLAFAQLLYAIAFKWTAVTGASDGLAGIPRRPGPFAFSGLTTHIGFYFFALFCLLAAYLFCRKLVSSPFGAVLQGIRENETKTRALGYNARGLQNRGCGHQLRFGRTCRRALRALRRFRQHRAAVLAPVWPGPDYGDRRRTGHISRPDPRRGTSS